MSSLSLKEILILLVILACIARIVYVFFHIGDFSTKWKQLIFPVLISSQLLLVFSGKVSESSAFIIIVITEICIFGTVFFIIIKGLKTSSSITDNLLNVFKEYLPNSVFNWVRMEIVLYSNAFYGISKLFRVRAKEGWTYWKYSNFPAIFALLIIIAPIEIFVVHYLLNINLIINIILIALYFISLLYIYGFWVSIKLNPHLITNKEIFLYRGCLAKVSFPINLIESLNIIEDIPKKKGSSVDITIPGCPIVEIVFSSQVKIDNLIGQKEQLTEKIYVSFDEPQQFCNTIKGLK
jgi:hypothetical protein